MEEMWLERVQKDVTGKHLCDSTLPGKMKDAMFSVISHFKTCGALVFEPIPGRNNSALAVVVVE